MEIFNKLSEETKKDFISIIIEELEYNCLPEETLIDGYGDVNELHFKLFNSDYYIIGHYQANKFIEANFIDVFNAIDIVKEYELSHFGEFTTDINSESVSNMLAYIIGEELIYTLDEKEQVKNIIKQLKNI